MKILLVEDDPGIAHAVTLSLRAQFNVDAATTLKQAEDLLALNLYDLIILDLKLPDGWASERFPVDRASATPILILSGYSSTELKSSLLKRFADDFLLKPFTHEELHARVQALLRRRGSPVPSVREMNGTLFDFDNRMLTTSSSHCSCAITRAEAQILDLLTRVPDQYVAFGRLYEAVWPSDQEPLSNTLQVHCSRIRKKFRELGCLLTLDTRRGLGIRITTEKSFSS